MLAEEARLSLPNWFLTHGWITFSCLQEAVDHARRASDKIVRFVRLVAIGCIGFGLGTFLAIALALRLGFALHGHHTFDIGEGLGVLVTDMLLRHGRIRRIVGQHDSCYVRILFS